MAINAFTPEMLRQTGITAISTAAIVATIAIATMVMIMVVVSAVMRRT
jgi:hypothetical protein